MLAFFEEMERKGRGEGRGGEGKGRGGKKVKGRSTDLDYTSSEDRVVQHRRIRHETRLGKLDVRKPEPHQNVPAHKEQIIRQVRLFGRWERGAREGKQGRKRR